MPTESACAEGGVQRKRSSAFTPIEKAVLLRLVNAKKDVLGCRQADFSTVKKKQQAWADIAADFSSHTAVSKRTPFQLKKFWNNSKRKTRIKEAARTFKATRQRAPVEELHCEIHVDPEQTAQMKSNGRREALGCEDGNGREDVTGSPGDAVPDGADSRPESLINDKEDYGNEGPSKPRGDSIPSSSKMAYEEHRVRLKALVVSYETELLKKQLAEEQLKMAKEEHLMKVQLIAAQMMRASGN